MRERNSDGTFAVEHGQTGTRLHNIWLSMQQRCNDPNHSRYQRYGGRGIRICEEWKDFSSFSEWALANGYEERMTIDRIDNDGDYEPGNCRWATYKQQAHNNSRSVLIEFKGEVKCLAEWVDHFEIKYGTAYQRLKIGLPFDEVFDKADRRYKK